MRFRMATLLCSLTFSVSAVQGPQDKELIRAFERLVSQYEAIGKDIEQIKRLMGRDGLLDGVEPLAARPSHNQRLRVRIEDAAKAFADEDFEKAKESLQLAWEESPDDPVVNYNLAYLCGTV